MVTILQQAVRKETRTAQALNTSPNQGNDGVAQYASIDAYSFRARMVESSHATSNHPFTYSSRTICFSSHIVPNGYANHVCSC